MKRLLALFLFVAVLLLALSAAADPVSSYADVQDRLLAAAYKVKPFDAVLSGTLAAIVPSYTFKNCYYLFVMVDLDDVSQWSTEDDNYFVVNVSSDADPLPWEIGGKVTVEGQIVSIYSSPVCPYILPKKINGEDI